MSLSVVSCTKKESVPAEGALAEQKTGRVVNLAIWSNYVSKDLLSDFEKKTGIHVEMSNYSSNEEILAKLQTGATGYDVVVPSDYMVFAMSKLGLLRELDRSQLPNFKSLDTRFLGRQYDSTNKYSVPYDWGTTGIAINRALYKGKLSGWKDLFNNPDLAGKFTLLDDVRETLGAALKAQGFSLNTKDPEQLKKAKALLISARKRVKGFTSEPLMPLVNGETPVAHIYMSDALQARKQSGGKIDYIIPEEGATLWIDNLVIPTGALHVKEAHAFINFLLEPASDVSTVMNVMVAPANKDAIALLPKEFQSNPALFPPEDVMKRLEMIQDLGEMLAQYDRVWTEVKAQGE